MKQPTPFRSDLPVTQSKRSGQSNRSGQTDMLNQINIPSPCSADWDAMKGDDQSRHCDDCALSVLDLSAMTRATAESSLRNGKGRLCVRFRRDRSGNVVTTDSAAQRPAQRPVQRPARRTRLWTRIASYLLVASGGWLAVGCGNSSKSLTQDTNDPGAQGTGVDQSTEFMGEPTMGSPCPPVPEDSPEGGSR